MQSIADASPQIRASADRAGRFLSLASPVSVLLSAIAVAMAAQRYARRHLDTIALMKCMGAPQRFVLMQTVVQLVAIALVTAVTGTALGESAAPDWPDLTDFTADIVFPFFQLVAIVLVSLLPAIVGAAAPEQHRHNEPHHDRRQGHPRVDDTKRQ